MDNQQLEIIEFRFNEKLNFRRQTLVDTFEGLFGSHENWPHLRKLLLRFCGQSGIQGDLEEIIADLKSERSGYGTRQS